MGASGSLLRKKDPDWEVFVQQEWRSDISREMDMLGGLNRPAIARGNSFTHKLAWLEATLNKHGTELEQFFNPAPLAPGASLKERMRRPKIPIPTLLAMQPRGPQPVAEWRVRIHAARRRVIITVTCAVRLMRGKVHGSAVPRLDHFDFAIYSTLGGDWLRVAEEQQRFMALREAVEAATVVLQDAIQAANNNRPATSDGSEPGSPSALVSQLALEGLDALLVGPQPPASPKPPVAGGPAIRRDALLAAGAGGGGGEVRSRDVSPITGLPPGRQGGARAGGGAARSNLGPSSISRSGSGMLLGPPHAHSSSDLAATPFSPAMPHRASTFSVGVGSADRLALLGEGEGEPSRQGSTSGHASAAGEDDMGGAVGGARRRAVDASMASGQGSGQGSGGAVCPVPPGGAAPTFSAGAPPSKKASGIFLRARMRPAAVEVPGGGHSGPPSPAAAPAVPTTPSSGAATPAPRPSLYVERQAAGHLGGDITTPTSSGLALPAVFASLQSPRALSPSRSTSLSGCAPPGLAAMVPVQPDSPSAAHRVSGAGLVPTGPGGRPTGLPDSPSMRSRPPVWAMGAAAAGGSQSGAAGGGTPGGVPHSPSFSGSAASAFQLPQIGMSGKQPPLRADTARVLMTAFADGSESPKQAGGLGNVAATQQRLRSSFSMDGRVSAGGSMSSPFDSGPVGPPGQGQAVGPSPLGLGGAEGGGAGGGPRSPSTCGTRPLAANLGAVGELRRSASGRLGSLDGLTMGAEGSVSDGGAGSVVPARRLPLRSDSRQSLRASASGLQRASSDASRFLGDASQQHPVAHQPHPVGLEEALSRARGSLSGTGAGPAWGPALGSEGGQLSPAGGAGANAVRLLQGALSPSPSMQRATTSVIVGAPGTSPHHHPSAPLSASGAGHDGAASPASPRRSPAVPGAPAAAAAGPRPVPPPGPATHVARSMSLLRHGSSLSNSFTSQFARSGGSEGGEAGASGCGRVGGGGGERLAVSVDVAAHIAKLKQQLQVKVEEMNRCSKLISMFLNRCNAAWAESQTWVLPPLASQPHLQAFARSEAAMVFRNELVKLLMTGGVAFHLRAADEVLEAGAVRAWGQGPDGELLGASTPQGSQSGSGGEAGRTERLATVGRGGDGAGGGGGGGTTTPGGNVGGGGGGGGVVVTPGLLCRSTAPDLWTHDPWRLLDTYRPGVSLDGPRMDHVSLGCRVVASLVLAVEAAAGRGAVSRLPLVLLVSEEQQDEVVRQLWGYNFFGVPRENVLVVVQPSHPGYAYDSERRTWRAGDAAHCLPLGSGYGLLQLAWQGEAQAVGEDGVLAPQPLSALSWMEARGVRWMLSRRVRDLSLLTREGALDINALAYGLYYHTDRCPSTNVIVEAQLSSSLAQSRALDSVVLCRKVDPFDSQPAPPHSHAASDRPTRSSAGSSSFTSSRGSGGGSGTGEPPPTPGTPGSSSAGGSGPTTSQVVELCYADLTTPAMHAVLGTAQAAGRVLAGVGRYMVHVPGIAAMLAGRLSVLRPKLGLLDGMLHLRMELADITSSRSASTLLLQARPELPLLQAPDDLDALLPLLQAQDGTPAFRQLVQSSRDDELRSAMAALWLMPAQPARVHPNAQRIVVFVVANAISAAAVSMAASVARAGRDTVVMVTVVAAKAFRDRAEQLCAKHVAAFERLCTAECVYDVIERGSHGLIDCMVEYVEARGATLVVMGSNALTGDRVESFGMSAAAFSLGGRAAGSSGSAATATGRNGVTAPGGITAATAASIHVVGSVTLALLRRMPLPLLLVTRQGPANPGVAAAAAEKAEREGRRRALRYMGLLDGGAKGMVDFVAGKLCNPAAGDQLHLAYVRATVNMTRQQQANVKALVGRYLHQVAGMGLRPTQTLLLDAPMEVSVANAVAEHSADVLTMVAGPLHSLVPPAVVATLRASRAAVLWYRDAHPAGGVAHT